MTAGRPRKFDENEVLERAMALFWEQGYEGTSLTQLRDVTGLSSASLYHAFGSKEGVFERVVAHYVERPGSVVSLLADEEADPKEHLVRFLHSTIDGQAEPAHPVGCLVALSATVGPADSGNRAGQIVAAQRAVDRARIGALIQRCEHAGVLREGASTTALTTLVHTFVLGLATQVHDELPIEDLHAAADALVEPWLAVGGV